MNKQTHLATIIEDELTYFMIANSQMLFEEETNRSFQTD